ncbi:MAG: rhodanese-like domain-containing protein [Candidatus Bipolaricaulia bacterium]
MELIGREELKQKLDRGDDFNLVMVLNEWAYRAKHIPGSLNISKPELALEQFDPDDEIVVYCSGESCVASIAAYQILKDHGYKNVRRYAGGLPDWEEAGYPLEGEMVLG